MPLINREIVQGGAEWFNYKLGRPSASGASRIITSEGVKSKEFDKYARDLAVEVYTGRSANNWKGNESTEFGKDKEPKSRSYYELITEQEVEEVGFIEDDLKRWLVSPDGINKAAKKGFEVKNKPALHINALIYYSKHKKEPTDHIGQVQMSLFVSKFDSWDLFYYSDDLPKLLITIEPDPIMQKAFAMYLPELIQKRDEIVKTIREFKNV